MLSNLNLHPAGKGKCHCSLPMHLQYYQNDLRRDPDSTPSEEDTKSPPRILREYKYHTVKIHEPFLSEKNADAAKISDMILDMFIGSMVCSS